MTNRRKLILAGTVVASTLVTTAASCQQAARSGNPRLWPYTPTCWTKAGRVDCNAPSAGMQQHDVPCAPLDFPAGAEDDYCVRITLVHDGETIIAPLSFAIPGDYVGTRVLPPK